MEEVQSINQDILTEVNKEKFKRRLSIFRSVSTRVIAILLVLAILWVGFVQMNYSKDVGALKEKYGPNAYCYLCGKEAIKLCSCPIQLPLGDQRLKNTTYITAMGQTYADINAQSCSGIKDLAQQNQLADINLSGLKKLNNLSNLSLK